MFLLDDNYSLKKQGCLASLGLQEKTPLITVQSGQKWTQLRLTTGYLGWRTCYISWLLLLHPPQQESVLLSLPSVSLMWEHLSVIMAILSPVTPLSATAPSSSPCSRSPFPQRKPGWLILLTISLGEHVFRAQLSGRGGTMPASLSSPLPISSGGSLLQDLGGPKVDESCWIWSRGAAQSWTTP
jgi:hypothetical protein